MLFCLFTILQDIFFYDPCHPCENKCLVSPSNSIDPNLTSTIFLFNSQQHIHICILFLILFVNEYYMHENNQIYKILKLKQKQGHAYFQIQIVKQKIQEQEHNTWKIKIQQDFIVRKKQKQNTVMTRKCTQN